MPSATRQNTALLCKTAACVLATAALLPTAQGQGVFRTVGPDGKVTFSDLPPPDAREPIAPTTTTSASGSGFVDTRAANLPFALRQLTSKYPVTLYSSNVCAPCDSGRNFLVARGIPYTEKSVNTHDDIDAFGRINSGNGLPFLTIGGQQVQGFSATDWGLYLDAAGYPKTSTLPSAYRHAAAQPLAPPKPVHRTDATNVANVPPLAPTRAVQKTPVPAVNPNNPAGIRF